MGGTELSLPLVIVISIIIFILEFGLTISAMYFGFVTKANERITKIETDNMIFWKVLDPHIAQLIHSPEHKERDFLMDKLVEHTLTLQEASRLHCLLEADIKEVEDRNKLVGMAFALIRVKTMLHRAGESVAQ